MLEPSGAVKALILVMLSAVFGVSCAQGPMQIASGSSPSAIARAQCFTITSDRLTFGWDQPAGEIESYKVYYLPIADLHAPWKFLCAVPATDGPQCVITESVVGSGAVAIAVSAVYANGLESAKSSSLDASASPPDGWYIRWKN